MRKIVFIHLFLTLFLIELQAQTIIRGPYLQKGSENSVTIKWRTDAATESKIEYGTNLNNLNQTVNDNTAKIDHEIEINGLNPFTKYFYNVGNSGGVLMPASNDLYFKTHPPIGTIQPISVWVLGDCGTGNTKARNVRDAYYAYTGNTHTDAILMLGDNAYTDGKDWEYQTAVFENMYEDKIKNTILWSCIGNHERVSDPDSSAYFDIFTFPTAGESGGLASGTEAYYSFDYGNIHFICLDSDNSDRDVGSPMYVWAENDIQNTMQDWIVAFWHHPAYTKGTHDSDTESKLKEMRANFVPMLEDNGVDLVLSGHSHTYERTYYLKGHHGFSNTFNSNTHTVGANGDGDGRLNGDGAYIRTTNGNAQNDGAVYVTAGSSGKKGNQFGLGHPAMYYSVSELGSCVLEVNGNQMDVKFLRDNGNIDDYFTIRKEAIVCSAGDPCDDGNPYTINDTYDSDCYCTGTVIGGSECLRITNGADDVEETSSGNMKILSTDLELVDDGGNQTVGLRFNNVDIPQGATITQAYLQFTVDEISTNATNLTISGEDVNNAAPFVQIDDELTNRTKTTANVNWVPPAWNTAGVSGSDQKTPDISAIIEEIVNRPGYNQNNSIAFFITGTGSRIAESYEGDLAGSPQLCFTYTTGGCPVTGQPCDDNDPCTINDVLNNNCVCVGTFEDTDNDGVCDADDACPNFDDSLIGTTCDDGDPNTTFDVYTTDCICEGLLITGNIVCRRINAGADDAEENISNGYVNTASSDIEMAFDLNDQICGFRFNAITIPQGATITSAHIQFQVDETTSGAANLTIQGENTDNAVSFFGNTSDLSNRTKTAATVSWSPPDWNTEGEAGSDQETPDLSTIIQEIVDRPGFIQNNSIALFVTGTGTRNAEAYEGDNAGAAELCIEFSVGGCTTTGQPCNDNDPCTINDVIDNNCNCIGTFQDSDNDSVCDADDQCPNLDDNLIGTSCDDGDPNTNNDLYTTNCICEGTPNGGNAVCRRISVGIDDVEENTDNGAISTGSTDIELVYDGNDQICGFRFNNISIPQGASITSANLQFTVDETNTGAANLTIHGEDTDNAASFANIDYNLSNRTNTSASVNWNPPDWTAVGEAGPDQLTPDLSAIIQEIVDRPGFNQDNSIALFVTGSGERTAESYNGDVASAALLCIEFSTGCATTGQPCNDGDPCTINDVIDNDCNCVGTFEDTDNDSVCDANDQCPNFDDTLIGSSCDDNNPNTNNDVYTTNCICEGIPIGNSVCRRISVGIDDIEENTTNGHITPGSSDLELVFDGNEQIVGLRFNDISIPQGASITNAYLQFTTDEATTGGCNLTIHGEDSDNPSTFTDTDYDLSNRTNTAASINWSPPDWNTVGEAGPDQQTPDLSTIIQEIVDRPGFSQNNSIVFLITGTGKRTAKSYNGEANAAPQLCIDYSTTPSLTFDLKVALEGAYDPVLGTMRNDLYTLELLPGMLFSDPNQIGQETPPGQPFNAAPWNYPGTEGLTFSNGDYDPMSVDWVLLSLRTGLDATTEIHQAAGLLKRDGAIEFLPGSAYQGNDPGPYYVLLEHRNHIGALSPQALVPQNGVLVYDFTTQNSWVPANGGFGQKELTLGFWGLYGGDGDQVADVVSYDINGADRILWNLKNGFFNQYEEADYDMNGEVTGADRILWNVNSGISSGVQK